MNLLTKQKETHRLRKQTYGCHKEKRIVREFGMVMYTLLYFKWITNKNLLYSTWNSAQHYLDGRGTGGECCDVLSRFSVQLCVTPLDCSPPASSVHEISQARILEWVAISFSRESSQPRDRTHLRLWQVILYH